MFSDADHQGYLTRIELTLDIIRAGLGGRPDTDALLYLPRALERIAAARFGHIEPRHEQRERFRAEILAALGSGELRCCLILDSDVFEIDPHDWRLRLRDLAFDGIITLSEYRGRPLGSIKFEEPRGYVFVTKASFENHFGLVQELRSSADSTSSQLPDTRRRVAVGPRHHTEMRKWIDRETTRLGGKPKASDLDLYMRSLGLAKEAAEALRKAIAKDLVRGRGRPPKPRRSE